MALKSFLLHALTWWHDSTLGTALFTRRRGEKVGTDAQGNTYYRERNGAKRWVIYNGDIEASRIPPEWHAWLHRLSDAPPSERPLPVKPWEKDHLPNRTGTDEAWRPPGSLVGEAARPRATGDYEAWTPS
ncbi:NADH:ubiquinone oxidoreductase subunit NDUFA12 [Zavarzinia sp. CC-PAN008]|uniref:NADH:ubiquinone oxidoreductase subunit NDUFA12 n=1 Tax=Zavarzinia sp. CC-PAN008 TaxID=3243332 RepID=UPI003F743603